MRRVGMGAEPKKTMEQQMEELKTQNAALEAENEKLKAENAGLKAGKTKQEK